MIKRYHGFSPESKLYNVIVIFSKQFSSPFHKGELKVSLFQSRFRVYERQQRLITCQVLLLCFVFMIFDKRVKIYTESYFYNLEMFHSLSTVRNRTFESSKYQLTQKAFRCQSNLFVVSHTDPSCLSPAFSPSKDVSKNGTFFIFTLRTNHTSQCDPIQFPLFLLSRNTDFDHSMYIALHVTSWHDT